MNKQTQIRLSDVPVHIHLADVAALKRAGRIISISGRDFLHAERKMHPVRIARHHRPTPWS